MRQDGLEQHESGQDRTYQDGSFIILNHIPLSVTFIQSLLTVWWNFAEKGLKFIKLLCFYIYEDGLVEWILEKVVQIPKLCNRFFEKKNCRKSTKIFKNCSGVCKKKRGAAKHLSPTPKKQFSGYTIPKWF